MQISLKEQIKNRFQVFFEYLANTQSDNNFFINEVKKILDVALQKDDIKTLKSMNKELDVWLNEMFKPSEKSDVLKLFKQKLNEDFDSDFVYKINIIVNKGVINTEDEYRMIMQRVESIYQDQSKESEMIMLNNLLANYESKQKK